MIKRLFLIFSQVLVFIAFSSAYSSETFYNLQYLSQTQQQIRIQVTFDTINVIQKKVENTWLSEIYTSADVWTHEPGRPQLPFVGLALGIPQTGQPVLRVVQENHTTQAVHNLRLLPADDPDTIGNMATGYVQYPASSAEIELQGHFRAQRILQLKLFPVRHNAQSNSLTITRSMIIEINMTKDKSVSGVRTTSVLSAGGSDLLAESMYTNMLDNPESARQWRGIPQAASLNKVNAVTAPYRYKLFVEQDGIYKVTGQELADAGIDLNTIAPSTLTLYNRGEKQPIIVEGDGDGVFNADDRIIFLGQHNPGENSFQSPYSESNVYWLTWGSGSGVRYAQVSGAAGPTNTAVINSAPVTIHLEKDLIYAQLLAMADEKADHWLWQLMQDGLEYNFTIPGPGNSGNGPTQIRVGFQGLTHLPQAPDHHVLIKYNQEIVGDAIWDNQLPYVFESENFYPAQNSESQTLSFNLPGDLVPPDKSDNLYLNWIEVSYHQPLLATNDSLQFSSLYNPAAQLQMSGFTSPELYLLTDTGTRITDIKTTRSGDEYAFTFTDHSPLAKTFYAASANGLKSVLDIQPVAESNLRSRANRADYIIITHADFAEQAQRLVNHRSANGLRAISVDVQDVFDEFGYGLWGPQAIKDFLLYAYANWQRPAPLYVLLMGDVTFYMDKNIARDAEYPRFVPTFMVYTRTWGMVSSDNYFATLIGDDELPDLYIGRLPVNTPEEAEIMVSKTIAHEAEYVPEEWRRHLLMLTGVESYFEESAWDLYHHHTPDYMIMDRIGTMDTSRFFGSTEEVAERINSGESILNFVGHGGGGVFSDAQLFQIEDIERLSNRNKYPFVFSLTCFIGHFDNPESASLAESLLAAKDKGIVGSFGSSGRAFLQGDYYLNNAIFDVVFDHNLRTYGAVSTVGKIEMVNQTLGFWDHVKSYNLLGDPALPLYIPGNTVNVQLSSQTLTDNQDLLVSGSVPGQTSGEVTVTVHNDFDSLLTTKSGALQSGAFNVNAINLNSAVRSAWSQEGGPGRVRVYFKNTTQEAVGAKRFSVGSPYIPILYTYPEQPRHNVPFFFVANINQADLTATLGQVDSLMIKWSYEQEQWYTMGLEEQTPGYWRTDSTLTFPEGVQIFYEVHALVNGSTKKISETKSVKVAYRPDLYPDAATFSISGEQQTMISVNIINRNIEASGPFTVNLYQDMGESGLVAIGDTLTMIGLDAKGETRAAFLWNAPTSGTINLVCIVDEFERVAESDERNNRASAIIGVATMGQGTSGELYDDSRRYFVNIPGNASNKNTSVTFTLNSENQLLAAASELQLAPIMPVGDTTWSAIHIQFADSSVQLSQNYTMAAFYDETDSLTAHYLALNALKIYAWNGSTLTWTGLESTINSNEKYISATAVPGYRIFAVMGSQDSDAPSIQIGVEGQNFADGDMVGKNPAFTILLSDSSGFDPGAQPVSIQLDAQTVDQEDISLYRNPGQKRQLTASFIPEITSGSHTLTVEARDVNGNTNQAEVTFSIAAEFSLESIANHPNPFVDETVIAFSLADVADEVKLDIYTVSGRLIRSFTFTDISGYVEQDWDGLDDEGRDVANGVYYLRFTAKQGDKRIEQIEKMARLQ